MIYSKLFIMRAVICFLLLISSSLYALPPGASTGASLFFGPSPVKYSTRLFMIQTAHFDIIFPESSGGAAEHIASFSDSIYREVSALLGMELPRRLPVIITDDTESANGFFTPFPYSKIVLHNVTPRVEGALGYVDDWLKILFIHELVHAVSLNSRGNAARIIASIIGDTATPAMLTMGWDMIEGVTVSFESLGGYGRVNDPYSGQWIRQDFLEGNFLRPDQVYGGRDLYPGLLSSYLYGGYFSSWLQETYGMERYGELWKKAGTGMPYRLNFRRTYDIRLHDAWESFRETMEIRSPVRRDIDPLTETYKTITAFTETGGKLYYACSRTSGIRELDPETGHEKVILYLREPIVRLDGSGKQGDEEGFLLINSWFATPNGAELVTRVFDLGQKKFRGPVFQEALRESIFFHWPRTDSPSGSSFDPDAPGIAAIALRNGYTDLVYADGTGITTLLDGSRDISFHYPVRIDDSTLAFLLREKGEVSIGLYRMDDSPEGHESGASVSGKLSVIRFPDEYHIRGLWSGGGRLLFTYNNDHSLSRLGMMENGQLFLAEERFSGGVFLPLLIDGTVYHSGRFSEGNLILRYSGALPSRILPGTPTPQDAGAVFPAATATPTYEKKPYRAHPFQYRPAIFPMMGTSVVPGYAEPTASVGAVFFFADPALRNNFTLFSTFDRESSFLNTGVSWNSDIFPFELTVTGGDIVSGDNGNQIPVRKTYAGAAVDKWIMFPRTRTTFQLSAFSEIQLLGAENSFSPESSAYSWDYSGARIFGSGGAGFLTRTDRGIGWGASAALRAVRQWYLPERENSATNSYFSGFEGERFESSLSARVTSLIKHPYHPFKRSGAEFSLSGDYGHTVNTWKTEAHLLWAPSVRLPFITQIYGTYSPEEVFEYAASGNRNNTFVFYRYPVYREYLDFDERSRIYLFGELAAGLFNLEIQGKIPLIPFYLQRVFAEGGYRGALNSTTYRDSAFGRLTTAFSPQVGVAAAVKFRIIAEIAYAFDTGEFFHPLSGYMLSAEISL